MSIKLRIKRYLLSVNYFYKDEEIFIIYHNKSIL